AFASWHMSHVGFATVSGTNYGALLDANGRLRVTTQTNYGGGTGRPRIATDGRDFLFVTYSRGFTDAQLIRADGTRGATKIVATHGIGSFTTSSVNGTASVVWTGSEYIVATTEIVVTGTTTRGNIVAATFTRDGEIGAITTIADDAGLMALAPAGPGRALAIWNQAGVVSSAFIGANGLVSTPQRIDAIPATASVNLATDGANFAAVFAQGSRIATLRLGATTPIELDTSGSSTQIVWDRDAFVVIWNDDANNILMFRLNRGVTPATRIGVGHIESASASSNGVIILHGSPCGAMSTLTIGGDDSIVSVAPSEQLSPRIVATNFGHQVTWIEGTSLFTRFIDRNGSGGDTMHLTDAEVLNVSSIPFEGGTAIVWGGGFARFDASGVKIGE